MFTRSHLQEMKRRYASIYAPPVEEKVIEDGTDEGAKKYKKDTPGQDIEKEFKEHCGVCGEQGIEEVKLDEINLAKVSDDSLKKRLEQLLSSGKTNMPSIQHGIKLIRKEMKKRGIKEEEEIEEGTALQVKMALSDVGLKGTWKNNKVYVKKKDVKKAEKALKGNVIYRGKPPVVVGEEVEIEEAKKPTRDAGMECMECGKKFRAKLSTLQYGRTKCPKCKSTDLDFAFGESVKEEVELVEKGVAYPPTIDNLRMIVKDKQHQTFMFKSGKAMVDLFTASAMVQVYDALKKPEMKKTFEKMIKDKAGFMKTQAFAMKMIGK